jgi:hypothetical protein
VNLRDPFAHQLEKHKTAVTNAETSIQLPLRSILSPDSGRNVTEQDAGNITFHIENLKTVKTKIHSESQIRCYSRLL